MCRGSSCLAAVVCSVRATGSSTMCSNHSARPLSKAAQRLAGYSEVDLSALSSTLSHYGGACCCKWMLCSTYQSGSGGLFESKQKGLFGSFYTAVQLQCSVLESEGEWTELVMRLGFPAVHAGRRCSADLLLSQQMARETQSISPDLLQNRNIRDSSPICSVWVKSDWRGLLSFGLAIKTASILVIKNRPLVIMFEQMIKEPLSGLESGRPSRGHSLAEQKNRSLN